MSVVRKYESDETHTEPLHKRLRLDEGEAIEQGEELAEAVPAVGGGLLPPSHSLLGVPLREESSDAFFRLSESDVGISEYVGRDVPKIAGTIKQRFTDFLVNEVDIDGQVIHIKSLAMPKSSNGSDKEAEDNLSTSSRLDPGPMEGIEADAPVATNEATDHVAAVPTVNRKAKDDPPTWSNGFDTALESFLSEDAIEALKTMFLEGREPPRVSDDGWARRQVKVAEGEGAASSVVIDTPSDPSTPDKNGTKGQQERGGRGGRGVRGGARGGRTRGGREDNRKVYSQPISDKTRRTELHRVVRELFGGKLETETDPSSTSADAGSRIIIKWSRDGSGRGGARGDGRGGGRGGTNRASRDTYPPYIHFTMQKTNRDTQDALLHLSRVFHVSGKDLSVAGTKDKRGVTVQRVSLKRGNKTVEDVWKMANSQGGRKASETALTQRGERGVRVADLNYRKAGLELGMLKGNAFVITLRNVQVDSIEILDRAMTTIKHKGFINYYGMQRFGTASVPTHSIGLAILQSDWHKAVNLILQQRPGEHPDVMAARDAWLVDSDLDRALELMPRRVVAERCILESYKKNKGDSRNAMGALSTIPRNLRLMYVHAYQSYVWNAIVSERIRTYGCERPIVGDLVFESDPETATDVADMCEPSLIQDDHEATAESSNKAAPDIPSQSKPQKKARKPWVAPQVKFLTQADLDRYTIFDVIMPLPGKDVDYPGGALGRKYKEYLLLDGLDPDNLERKQKDYSLSGSYRKIMHLPKELSWSVLRYTDPDVALAQADEDKLLGFDPPALVEDGKFMALQINLTLGTAAYATMALREITKTETGTHFQTALTRLSEDQQFRVG